jgi:hypothetical protein
MYRSRMSAMKAWLFAGVVVAGGAACTKPNPALSCEDGLCSDPLVPFCDVTGAIEGEPNTCIKPSCTPNMFEECRGDKALMCNSTGSDYDLLTCTQGCSAAEGGCKPEPPCETLECKKHIIPKYLPTECDELATNGALTISADTELDTSDDSKCTRIVQQPLGPEICVLHYQSITIETNKTYGASGSRALALISDETLVIDGVLDVGYHNSQGGPGGGLVMSGGYSITNKAGGGGAGGRTDGGHGGTTQTGGGANGGEAIMNPATLNYVVGGARTPATPYNNGGGAAIVVACRGALKVQGTVDVSGGGGHNGYLRDIGTGQLVYRAATGGGAAGMVVLQGLSLSITGQLYANGGGGGGGGNGTGGPGYEGQRSTAAAAGGTGTATGGTGGAGGALGAPQGGVSDTNGNGGGGGGAAGFFFLYSPGTADVVTPTAVSPSLEPKSVIATN